MITPTANSGKRTVGDLYSEAKNMFIQQMEDLKKRPLTEAEKEHAQKLAVLVSNGVLKDMKII